MPHIKVDQFIMNLVDFLSPDDYIRPNPLVNACAFILVLGITTMSTNLLAYKLILAMNFNASLVILTLGSTFVTHHITIVEPFY